MRAARRAAGALAAGAVFGFLLSRAEATRYDRILGMFLLRDPHLYVVIGVAVAVAAVGLRLLARLRGAELVAHHKPRHAGNLLGGLIFGVGWALSGTCPGTGLAQVGEGRLAALFTVAGMLAGAALHVRYGRALRDRLDARIRARRRARSEAR